MKLYYTMWNAQKKVSTQERKLDSHWKYFTSEKVVFDKNYGSLTEEEWRERQGVCLINTSVKSEKKNLNAWNYNIKLYLKHGVQACWLNSSNPEKKKDHQPSVVNIRDP